jgi:hypothetical protein
MRRPRGCTSQRASFVHMSRSRRSGVPVSLFNGIMHDSEGQSFGLLV